MKKSLFFSITVSLLLASAGGSLADDDVHFQMSWIPSGEYAPFSAGIEKGFFKDSGINLTMTTGRGSADAIGKVAAGASPFGDGDISAVMAARVNGGAPVKCAMSLQTKAPHAIYVLEESGIKDFKDLAGHTIGTTAGNSHVNYFPVVAKAEGFDPGAVKWATMEASSLAPMLIGGKIDGVTLTELNTYYLTDAAEKQGKHIKILPYSENGLNIYAYCIAGNVDFMSANPDLTKRFLYAVQKSYLWARDNRQEAAEIHNRRYPELDIENIVATLQVQFKYMFNDVTDKVGFGKFDPDRVLATYNTAAPALKFPPSTDISQFYDTSYLSK